MNCAVSPESAPPQRRSRSAAFTHRHEMSPNPAKKARRESGPATGPDTVVVLDYGSQYTQLITRRVRELGVFSCLLPGDVDMVRRLARSKTRIYHRGIVKPHARGAPPSATARRRQAHRPGERKARLRGRRLRGTPIARAFRAPIFFSKSPRAGGFFVNDDAFRRPRDVKSTVKSKHVPVTNLYPPLPPSPHEPNHKKHRNASRTRTLRLSF